MTTTSTTSSYIPPPPPKPTLPPPQQPPPVLFMILIVTAFVAAIPLSAADSQLLMCKKTVECVACLLSRWDGSHGTGTILDHLFVGLTKGAEKTSERKSKQ
ncbi:hypothetical protein Tco_0742385 [Tanacetum coccineum]